MAIYGLRLCRHCGKPFPKKTVGPVAFCGDGCRFWSHVQIGSEADCWEWQASRGPTGYGLYPNAKSDEGKSFHSAHRAAYYYAYEILPKDKALVLHKCDNRACCNPHHLYVGSVIDNNRDKRTRFRAGKKLNVEAVRLIKADTRPAREVAVAHGVSVSTIFFIRAGKIWAAA